MSSDGSLVADTAVADAATDPDANTADDAALVDAQGTDAAAGDAGLMDLSASYTVTGPVTAAYSSLSAETGIGLADSDDGVSTLAIPFSFSFFRAPLTDLLVSANGFAATTGLTMPDSATNTTFPTPALPNGILAPWWEDLTIDLGVAGGASLAHQLQGTAPDRVFVIQWRGVRLSNQATANHRRFHFQLALFETSNIIEYRYGETQTSGNPGTVTSASVGAEDPSGTIGQNLLTCTPTCAGPARPTNPNGFPRQSVIRLTPK